MPTIFIKRFWGFTPETWPIVSFGLDGNRRDLITKSKPGDMIAFVGTKTKEVAPRDLGRLLGVAEFARQEIKALEILDEANLRPEHYVAGGRFKWPEALPMVRAWRFPDRPPLLDVVDNQLTYEATVRAVSLSDREQVEIANLKREEAELPEHQLLARLRERNDRLVVGRPSTGPVPSFWSGGGGHDPGRPGTTYAMQFGNFDLWKIGWCADLNNRARALNKHIPAEVVHGKWVPAFKHDWRDRREAFEMEQRVLKALQKYRTDGERVACSRADLEQAWCAALVRS